MTSCSTSPNRRRRICRFSTREKIITIMEKTTEIIISCPADTLPLSLSRLPIYWLTTTAPPAASAENRKRKTVLNILTRDTPDTAASPA